MNTTPLLDLIILAVMGVDMCADFIQSSCITMERVT